MNPSQPLRATVAPTPLSDMLRGDTVNLLPLSDLHLPRNPISARRILANRAYLQRMNGIVLLGDMCGCYGTDGEYAALDAFVHGLERPYTAINGNHEFYFEVFEEGSAQYGDVWEEQEPAKKRQQLTKYREFFGFESLWRSHHTPLGSFIFLGLDDVENHKAESLSAEQAKFLARELQAAPEHPAYVFCHVPLMLDKRLDLQYYDEERTACEEPPPAVVEALTQRAAPVFWMSGHIHLRPDHYLFPAYLLAPGVWQVHCPDSASYSRWAREHTVPQGHDQLFSRHLEIRQGGLDLVTHDHLTGADTTRQSITF